MKRHYISMLSVLSDIQESTKSLHESCFHLEDDNSKWVRENATHSHGSIAAIDQIVNYLISNTEENLANYEFWVNETEAS